MHGTGHDHSKHTGLSIYGTCSRKVDDNKKYFTIDKYSDVFLKCVNKYVIIIKIN